MIGVAGKNGPGPVKLFGNDNSHELMGKGKGRQRQLFIGSAQAGRVQTIGTTHQQRDIAPLHAPITQLTRQRLGIEGGTVLIEGNDPVIITQGLQQPLALGSAGARFSDRYLYQFQRRLRRQAAGIVMESFAHPWPGFIPHDDEANLHTG